MTPEIDCEHAHRYETHYVLPHSHTRRILAQFLATTVKNLILFDIGLQKAIPAIIIPALTGLQNEHNVNETLSLTPVEASWLGSIGYILVPVGCLFSGLIADALGRRRAMLIVNIPFIVSWFMLYRAASVVEVFIAYALLGFGVGLSEAPIITYIGEICEPTVRGVMIAYSSFAISFGSFFIFTLNTLMAWRMVALVCIFVPVLTAIGLFFVPETPMWLLSQNRTAEAKKSLCWLRGWASNQAVAAEFQDLRRYSARSQSCDLCIRQNQKCAHPSPALGEKISELMQPKILKPFFIVTSIFVIGLFSGITGMVPFIVQIFKAYDSPFPADQTAAIFSFVSNLGIAAFLILLRFTGKRPLYLTMLGSIIVVTATISAYGFIMLPSNYNSFDHKEHFTSENHKILTYIPFVCLFLWNFCTFCCVNSMGTQMVSELFPYKTRGITTGLSEALAYVFNFILIKLYFNLETLLSLPGYTLFSCIFATLGFILMYSILPETEGRTLEDIELHFSDRTKKLTDHKISKPKKSLPNVESYSNELGINDSSIKDADQTLLNQSS